MKHLSKIKNKAGIIILILITIISILPSIGCKKEKKHKPIIETGTVTDIDGNVYKTVNINGKWWMAENLKVKRYNNRDSVNFVSVTNFQLDSATWNNLQTGAYCIIDNIYESSQNYQGKMFGFLYNFYAVSDSRNIAPAGWHIPTDDEWKNLEEYIGMSSSDLDKVNWRGSNEGNKLKIEGPAGWNKSYDEYSIWGTNDFGFSAIGGGCCMYNGIWGEPGTFSTGFWWTSTLKENKAWYRYLDYNKTNVFRYYGPKTYGFSIRCVKD